MRSASLVRAVRKTIGVPPQRLARLTHLAAELDSISARDHDIQQQQSRTFLERVRQHGMRAGVTAHAISGGLKMVAHQACDIGVIFNDKDFLLVAHTGCGSGVLFCWLIGRLVHARKRSVECAHNNFRLQAEC